MKQLELQAFIWQQTADKDWSLNNMNWLALSGAAPWSPPFFRVYHPARCSDDSLRGEAWVILEIHCGGAKDGLITECKGPRGGLVSMTSSTRVFWCFISRVNSSASLSLNSTRCQARSPDGMREIEISFP